ncbi:MAG: hypothetical protein CEN87_57 [Parcubacteria group bacterium Licking1014_1]|nr:MAG: hypothetical protein CEN87_57 [Parcubacteria group bacterium Licking1014_1]
MKLILNSKFLPAQAGQIPNSERGVTLVEIIVVVFIVALFSTIMFNDFPKIKQQFALSRTAYKFAQDLRAARDLGMSGVRVLDEQGDPVQAKGYGVFIDLMAVGGDKKYIIYADLNNDQQYTSGIEDYIIETINLDGSVFIKEIGNIKNQNVSINFKPPNPNIAITELEDNSARVKIVFAVEINDAITREVYANISGLIEMK